MQGNSGTVVLDRLLDPVARCLSPESARFMVDLRADPQIQARVEELADKCTEGTLTNEECNEYDAYVWAGSLIAVLQAKARSMLDGH